MSNVNCTVCPGCVGCVDCVNCRNCVNCTDCAGCTNCRDCTSCINCTGLTGYEGLWIDPVEEVNNPRFTEVIAVLSTVAPGVSVTDVGYKYPSGNMWVMVPKINK